jgi:hypothetical protein
MLASVIVFLLIPLIFYYFVKLFLVFIKKEVNTEGCDKVCDTLIKVAKAIMKFFYFLILFMVLVTTCQNLFLN